MLNVEDSAAVTPLQAGAVIEMLPPTSNHGPVSSHVEQIQQQQQRPFNGL